MILDVATYSKQDRQCTYKRNIQTRSRNYCFRGKATSITHSECVFVALVIHNAVHMRNIIFSSAACPVLSSFSTLSHKRHDFQGIYIHIYIYRT